MKTIEVWRALTQTQEVISFFRGIFTFIEIEVEDTGERFSCRHLGTRLEFSEKYDRDDTEFTVRLSLEHMRRLEEIIKMGKVTREIEFELMSLLFTPTVAGLLAQPIFNGFLKSWFFTLAGFGRYIHVSLVDDDGNVITSHTLSFEHRKWNVTPGLQGTPDRVYISTVEELRDYRRGAMKYIHRSSTFIDLIKFGRWYLKWRKNLPPRRQWKAKKITQ